MSNQLNDPTPILLTDRLSTATAGAADLQREAWRVAERLLDSAFGPLTLRPRGVR